MPGGISWTISGDTILVVVGWLTTIAAFLYRRGGSERSLVASVEQLRKDHDALAKGVVTLGKEVDASVIAYNAGFREVRDRLAEHQADAARSYATKQDLIALEERTVKGMDRIVDRLDQISGRLETIGENVLKALLDRARA